MIVWFNKPSRRSLLLFNLVSLCPFGRLVAAGHWRALKRFAYISASLDVDSNAGGASRVLFEITAWWRLERSGDAFKKVWPC